MNGRILPILLAVLAILAPVSFVGSAAGAGRTMESDHTPTEVVYLALGDSIAAGVGASPAAERGYAALLADHLDARFGGPVRRVNLAVPGETTGSMLTGDQLARAVRAIVAARRTGVEIGAVTLTIGANDLLRAGSTWVERDAGLATIRANLATILGDLNRALTSPGAAPAASLVVTGYYDPTESPREIDGSDGWWLALLDATLAEQARAVGARWVDVAAAFGERTRELTWYPRDFHPTDEGHAVIAEAIWDVLSLDNARAADVQAPPPSALTNALPARDRRAADAAAWTTSRSGS